MSTVRPLLALEDTFVQELEGLYEPWRAATAPDPRLLVLNAELAEELGLDPEALATSDGVDLLVGNVVQEGSHPVAQAYAGHQFGGFQPRLGDGRALLVGELVDRDGRRRDLHLKGSGRTPFSRGGDGLAAVGPMLREHVMGEAMHALGIPTTRALAVVATGADVRRETMLPGAVLVRIAASHLRVGTFQYAAGNVELLRRLADHAIARHHPQAADAENPYLAFYEAVVDAQATLLSQWMAVGFVHGVMNTDNTTISGETIDYGPCAFMEAFDPATVFSSIDQGGRYAYGNQPQIVQWNLARLAEPLLPLIAEDQETAVAAATTVLHAFRDRYLQRYDRAMRRKLGVADGAEDETLSGDLLALLQAQGVDHTAAHRALSSVLRDDPASLRSLFADPRPLDAWLHRWEEQLRAYGADRAATAEALDRVNRLYVPRNHLVEEALAAATAGDLGPYERLVDVVREPYVERPGLERYAAPAPPEFGVGYQTFCGT
jgi:uncharacterized protein YdiU (UPF0061 family)